MKATGIENFAGRWADDSGRSLVISVRDNDTALVTLLVNGTPMMRPWCENQLATDLQATYCEADGTGLVVDLGRAGFGTELPIPE